MTTNGLQNLCHNLRDHLDLQQEKTKRDTRQVVERPGQMLEPVEAIIQFLRVYFYKPMTLSALMTSIILVIHMTNTVRTGGNSLMILPIL